MENFSKRENDEKDVANKYPDNEDDKTDSHKRNIFSNSILTIRLPVNFRVEETIISAIIVEIWKDYYLMTE